jgi:CBS domain-containing protein
MRIQDMPEFRNRDAVLTKTPDTSVHDAVQAMSRKNYGSCAVVDGQGRLAGIVTERDIMRRVVGQNLDPHSTKLAQVMTADTKTARADDDVMDCLRQMSNGRFRHMPVVDGQGQLVGMTSQGDFVAYTWPELFSRVKQNAQASLAGKPAQVYVIVLGVLIYALLVPFVFGLV